MAYETTDQGKNYDANLIWEPITREDGDQVALWEYRFKEPNVTRIEVRFGPFLANYTPEEVLLLGDGDRDKGLVRIAQAYYKAPSEYYTLEHGMPNRLFNDELDSLKTSRDE